MSERKRFRLFVTDRAVADAVNSGCQTSKDVAGKIGAHRETVRRKMQEMYHEGLLVRRKIGQTYLYAVADDDLIKEDTTEADRAELARKIREAKQPKDEDESEDDDLDFFRKIKAAKRK